MTKIKLPSDAKKLEILDLSNNNLQRFSYKGPLNLEYTILAGSPYPKKTESIHILNNPHLSAITVPASGDLETDIPWNAIDIIPSVFHEQNGDGRYTKNDIYLLNHGVSLIKDEATKETTTYLVNKANVTLALYTINNTTKKCSQIIIRDPKWKAFILSHLSIDPTTKIFRVESKKRSNKPS